uniref:UDP-glycosyltransferase 73D1-like n=1 Tax=Nicotiana tabacum TaxID=4097 RepID=A0A1S3YAL0_TOBAC|nr:PREDICTED: UDP-glycosyltransferase 73D1-like [Nicotiana tabacum]
METKPSCIISTGGLYWTQEIADKFKIPRYVFQTISCFALLCSQETGTRNSELPNETTTKQSDDVQSVVHQIKWSSIGATRYEPKSVVYVSFGSLCHMSFLQIKEIGLGLESSNVPFIWIIRGLNVSSEVEKWLSDENFEEKIGIRVGIEEKNKVLVKKEEVKKAINQLMNEGLESEERRKRAKELAIMSKEAMKERGSSYLNIKLLIQDVMQLVNN